MNLHTNYNEPFSNSWDAETVVTHISYHSGAFILHSTTVEAEEFTFPHELNPLDNQR